MDKKTIEAIEKELAKGNRIELIPVKGGIRIMKIRRETLVKTRAKEYNTREN